MSILNDLIRLKILGALMNSPMPIEILLKERPQSCPKSDFIDIINELISENKIIIINDQAVLS